jgi:hypothetical protein
LPRTRSRKKEEKSRAWEHISRHGTRAGSVICTHALRIPIASPMHSRRKVTPCLAYTSRPAHWTGDVMGQIKKGGGVSRVGLYFLTIRAAYMSISLNKVNG